MLPGKRETMCPDHLAPQGDRAGVAAEKPSPCAASVGTHDSAEAWETNLERHQWVWRAYIQVHAQKERKQGPKEMSARPHSPPGHTRQQDVKKPNHARTKAHRKRGAYSQGRIPQPYPERKSRHPTQRTLQDIVLRVTALL